jgi:hypothetical protein
MPDGPVMPETRRPRQQRLGTEWSIASFMEIGPVELKDLPPVRLYTARCR